VERIYFYKLTADNGGAPCVEDGLLSLAICKPAIHGCRNRRHECRLAARRNAPPFPLPERWFALRVVWSAQTCDRIGHRTRIDGRRRILFLSRDGHRVALFWFLLAKR
jgi:hypothetical protein